MPRTKPFLSTRARTEVLWWAATAAVLALALLLIERPQTYFWIHFSNALHVLISAGMALVALRLSRIALLPAWSRWVHYFASGVLVVGFGAAFELGQVITSGSPSLYDVLLDALGGLSGLLFGLSIDRQVLVGFPRARVMVWLMRLGALLVLGLGLYPSFKATQNAWLHRGRFPILNSFEYSWEQAFVNVRAADSLRFVRPPNGFARAHGDRVARCEFAGQGDRPPRFKLVDLGGDWSSFSSLDFEVYAPPGQPPVKMTLSLHDDGPMGTEEHFNFDLEFRAGSNTLSIPREFIRTGASNRPMHLDKVHELVLFADPFPQSVTLYFDFFRLTR